jgi:hypothetical protein
LAGREYTGNEENPFVQVRLDVRSQATHLDVDSLNLTFDVDSVIGIVRTVRLNEGHSLSMYSVINFRETLKKDNHLLTTISHSGTDISVPPHTIPNFCMAKIGTRGKVVVLLPRLYRPGLVDRTVKKEYLEIFYNNIVRRAVNDIDPGRLASIPVSYAAAEAQQKARVNGQYHFSTFDIAGQHVEALCHAIEQYAQQYPTFSDIIYLIEFCGIKGESCYVVCPTTLKADIVHSRWLSVADCFDSLDQDMVLDNPFWVDVGAEVTLPGKSLRLLRDAHPYVLQWIFPGMNENAAQRVCKHRSFQVNTYAQIYDIVGFWSSIQSNDDVYGGAEYIQAYFTDKSFTYALHKNIWSPRSARETLPQGLSKLCSDLEDMSNLIRQTRDNPGTDKDNNPIRLDGGVHIEVCVPWDKAENVLLHHPDHRILRRMFIAVDPKAMWWVYIGCPPFSPSDEMLRGFVWVRLMGILIVFQMIKQSRMANRAQEGVAALSAILIFTLNALFVRESTRSKDVHLRDSCGRRALEEVDPVVLTRFLESDPINAAHGLTILS